MNLEKYSVGIGDRFGQEGIAQLKAFVEAKQKGVNIVPVWNKSNREHSLIGSSPRDVKSEAKNAVSSLGWKDSYYMDADHINLNTVEKFLSPCNFFTIDVADYIGLKPAEEDINRFLYDTSDFLGDLNIPGLPQAILVNEKLLKWVADKYLTAIIEAGKIYRFIRDNKKDEGFVTEVSFDESNEPQTISELFFILFALAKEKVPLQTIAPKFPGRFNKGVDYEGDIKNFLNEFEKQISVIKYAVSNFNLPSNLKISIHTGSDKFSLYPGIHKILKKHDAGVHLKTAGTTWLEEVIGIAEGGSQGLDMAKSIYRESLRRSQELIKPYETVVNIDFSQLPEASEVERWSSEKFADTLRHDQNCKDYNVYFRQLIHVGFKVAAEMKGDYLNVLNKYSIQVAKNVTENIYSRHIKPLFLGD